MQITAVESAGDRMEKLLQLIVSGITSGAVYAILGLGYVVIYRTSHIVNLGQGMFFALGVFFAYSFYAEMHLPLAPAIIFGVLSVMILAILLYAVVLRKLMKSSFVNVILATVAFALLFENIALNKWGGYGLSLPALPYGDSVIHMGSVTVNGQNLWVILLTALIFVGLYLLNTYTRVGRKMTATATDPKAARLCGISTNRMIMLAFAISAGAGALAGIVVSPLIQIGWASDNGFGMVGFVAAIVGGWGSILGAVLGGLTIGIVESLASGWLPAGYQDVIVYAVLIIILYFRPQGILGTMVTEGEM
jgi:branched-chain amino acid transport system permease protein